MNVAVSLYGESNGPAGWLWWADVSVSRDGQFGWVGSTGTAHTPLAAFEDGLRLLRTAVAIRVEERENARHGDD
jgi:hypothetical protein